MFKAMFLGGKRGGGALLFLITSLKNISNPLGYGKPCVTYHTTPKF